MANETRIVDRTDVKFVNWSDVVWSGFLQTQTLAFFKFLFDERSILRFKERPIAEFKEYSILKFG
jgi:hypothetical protein